MSIEAYKIAVKIALTENVTRGLLMMSSHFKATEGSAKALQDRIAKIGKMTMIGGGLVGAGGVGLKMLEAPLNKALEYERFIAQLRQQGLGDSQIAEARKFSDATNVINTSMLDRMRIFTEAQGAFREGGKSGSEALQAAKDMMPVLATYETAMKTLSGEKHAAAEGSMRSLNKIVEMMGGLGDTQRAKEIADGVFKAVQSSGKMVDERQLKQFFAYGSSATNQQNLRTVFAELEPIIAELGGSTTAVGLRTAYTRTNGMMAMPPKRMVAEMNRLGITDGAGKQNAELAHLQSTDVIAYTKEIMKRYEKAGITSQTDRERENALIFGTNGSKVFNKIMSQMEVLEHSGAAYDKAKGASATANDPANKGLMGRELLAKKIEDFQLVLGQSGGLIDLATKGMTYLADAIGRVAEFAQRHPTITKLVVEGFAMMSMIAIVAGGVLLLSAAMTAFMTLNPLGWVIIGFAALAAGAIFLWRNWSSIQPKIEKVWQSMVNYLVSIWNGAKAKVVQVWIGIGAKASEIWNGMKNQATQIWTNTKASLGEIWAGIRTGSLDLWVGVKNTVLELWQGIKSGFNTFVASFLQGWQSLFNSLIAGINKLLPAAAELQKLSFADDYVKKNLAGSGDGKTSTTPGASPFINTGNDKPTQITVVSQLDGREVARSTTMYQAKEANRPNTGAPTFDTSIGAVPPGLGYAP